ncbi:MAG: FAD-dependent oxidoreductase [Candidatus Omnitrophota bacterium]|jgi:flavin-dependent dehydrogenase|nr:MAG: FAD-dependent oxidoreductase [Candidatus Omnitrophota bacterium]
MNRNHSFLVIVSLFFAGAIFAHANATVVGPDMYEKTVVESAREIPVAYDVDVVVVGGTSAGVAAAVEAAKNGASVFLAAPRPYLGEDLCATYRLWLDADDEPTSPLAKELFQEPQVAPGVGRGMRFRYEADSPSADPHKDRVSPPALTDGRWGSASSQSVQYNGDVSIVADLTESKRFERVHVMAFQRNNDFEVDSVAVFCSNDKQEWKPLAQIRNEIVGKGEFEDSALDLSAVVSAEARYVKFDIKKTARVQRILIGEIIIEEKIPQISKSTVRRPPTPMHVKYTLDQALLDAGVQFLYTCYTADILYDAKGRIGGIVMVNRSGRQAVRAKVVIDAMPRADVARMAGVEFLPYPAGTHSFQRIVIDGEPRSGDGVTVKQLSSPIYASMAGNQSRSHPAFLYTLELPMKDGSFASFAKAEQAARDKTWQKGQVDSSEVLFQIPPDPMKGKKSLKGEWPGANVVDLAAFQPAKVERLHVLNGCADVSRKAAEDLLHPSNYIDVGTRIGKAAADEAKRLPKPTNVQLTGRKLKPTASGEVKELLVGLRPMHASDESIPSQERSIPIVGEYDVIVVGGGTGGAPAGIGAGRRGAKTLVVEYLHGLGGIGTLGLIGKYYHGYRDGFTKELDEGIAAMSGDLAPRGGGWDVEIKIEWYRRELRKVGVDIWYGALGGGAFVEDGVVKGIVVATTEGRGVVLGKVVIDSTGNADVAIAAGAAYMFTDAENAALQGTGLPPRNPGASYTNTDYTFTDESDVIDLWRTYLTSREKFKDAYDLGQIIDARERRRIVGDFVISPMDMYNNRTYPDSVVLSRSNFDSHGYTTHERFLLKPPDRESISAYTPMRSMLPKGLDGVIVTGLGVSAHRDAMPILRMQPCIQNQGYAMGTASAMVVADGVSIRQLDIKKLQQHLVEKGNLPASVLTDVDSYPLPKEQIDAAVKNVAKQYDWITGPPSQPLQGESMPPSSYEPVGVILSQPSEALPLLRQAFQAAEKEEDKLVYAHILGMLGDPTGSESLRKAVEARTVDKGWSFKGMGQFGQSLSPLDSLIIALGKTKDKRALDAILEKAALLDANSEFSHFRAAAIAMETLKDSRAARPLAELLQKPGIIGHAVTTIAEMEKEVVPGAGVEDKVRDRTLRELVLARALYRCGDYEGLGEKILKQYAQDLRGHYARHAHAVLMEGK